MDAGYEETLRRHREMESAWYADYHRRVREHLAAAIAKSPYRVVHETR